MELNNIIERRKVNDGNHSLTLEVSKSEFDKIMTGNIEDTAISLVEIHLKNREDDGRAENVSLDYNEDEKIVRIYADVEYMGNNHTDY